MEPEILEEKAKKENDKFSLVDFVDLVELFVFAISAILIIFTIFCRISFVQGSSMESTLLENDVLLVSDLLYTPTVGDVVVVQAPGVDDGAAIVKRIIATEGQTVEIKTDGVYVDGQKLEETDGSLSYTVNFSPFIDYEYTPMKLTVGEGQVFVLGDHRSVSLDSRYFGTVDQRCVIGKVFFRLFPFDTMGGID